MVNYYVELGLERGFDEETLKKELSKLRRKWQNRANSATTLEDQHKAENMMKLIREASAILLVKEERAKYDKKLDKDPVLSGQQAARADEAAVPYTPSVLDEAAALDALDEAYDKGRYNSVEVIAADLIKNGNADSRVYRILALSYIEMDRMNHAIMTMQDMVHAMPEDTEARYYAALFDLRLLSNRVREARKHIDWLLQSEEGASARVAALDVEYYIDMNDFELAEAKTEEYRKTVGRDRDFTMNVGLAYRQHAESFCTEYGGASYFESAEQFKNWKKYHELSLSIYPDANAQSQFQNNLKLVNGITFEKSNFPGIVFAFILGAIWIEGGGSTTAVGLICILLGIFITVFSFVPKWMAHKAAYTGSLEGLYVLAQWASKVVGIVFNAIIWLVKAIFALIFSFI